ncbi:MAG: HPr family phosphocarrier protein [Myxococcales bacterium]|nr:HPr family phosphocarrier protein [Myxococcales bacterium]
MSERSEGTFTVRAELGLHARPAGIFVAKAGSFHADIEVARAEGDIEWVDGRSILSLLSLAAAAGTRLRIRAEGDDAVAAVEALGHLLEEANEAPAPTAATGSQTSGGGPRS